MQLDFTIIAPAETYRWLVSAVTPQPIVWISALSAESASSLTPFSFPQVTSDEPSALMVNVSLRSDGSLKDTLRNVQVTGQLVIHLVGTAQAETMSAISAWLPHGVSEIETIGIPTTSSVHVAPPWIAVAAMAFECEVAEIEPYPTEDPNCHLIFAHALLAHVNDAVLADERHVDSDKLDLVGRLGDSHYSYTCDIFSMIRPGQPDSVRCPRALIDRASAHRRLVRGLPFLPLAIDELVAFRIHPTAFQWRHDTRAQRLFSQRQVRGQTLELPGLLALVALQNFDVVRAVGRHARQIVHDQPARQARRRR